MSGLELLLQAAGCSDDASSICSAGRNNTIQQDSLYPNILSAKSFHHKISRSGPNIVSLPPKKRMKVKFHAGSRMNESFQVGSDTSISSSGSTISRGSCCTDSPTLTSEWTETMAAEMKPQERPQENAFSLCNSMIVTTQNANSKKRGRKSSTKSKRRRHQLSESSTSKSAKNNLLVKDVDGNDMGMGYFSMPKLPTLKPRDAIKDEEQTLPMNDTHSSKDTCVATTVPDTSMADAPPITTAKSLLHQAYLQALYNSITQ